MKVLAPEGLLLEMVGAPEGAAWGNCLEGRGLVWLPGRGWIPQAQLGLEARPARGRGWVRQAL